MKARTIEIRWHWKDSAEPVFSIDHHANSCRIATAGSDNAVKIWEYTKSQDGFCTFTFVSCLARSAHSVNVVRFFPNGQCILSAHDSGLVVVWQKTDKPTSQFEQLHDDQLHNLEHWTPSRTLRATEDVYSLAFSPNLRYVISGTIDHCILIWDLSTGKQIQKLQDHAHFVQGLSWDPLNVYFASQSSDRTAIIYIDATKKNKGSNKKREFKFDLEATLFREEVENGRRYFRDETASTFFRRLSWSPDGLFLITVCGQYKESTNIEPSNCAYVFLRGYWDRPFLQLPVPDDDNPEPVVGAQWSPVFYQPKQPLDSPWKLEHYRMVFALYTLNTLLIYDTSCSEPIGMISNLHLCSLTDVTWSPDGEFLMVSSKDGYVSVVTFEGELGNSWNMIDNDVDLPVALQEVRRIRNEIKDEGGVQDFFQHKFDVQSYNISFENAQETQALEVKSFDEQAMQVSHEQEKHRTEEQKDEKQEVEEQKTEEQEAGDQIKEEEKIQENDMKELQVNNAKEDIHILKKQKIETKNAIETLVTSEV